MKVQDLMEWLEEFDPSATVVISRDPEGNEFAPVEELAAGFFNKKSGDAYTEDDIGDMDTSEDDIDDFSDSDDGYVTPKNYTPAVILWPGY